MKTLILFFAMLLIGGCMLKSNDYNNQAAFINEVFLKIVDTSFYKYNTLRPDPLQEQTSLKKQYKINVLSTLTPPAKWKKEILSALNNSNASSLKQNYFECLKNIDDSSVLEFPFKKVLNTGRYLLIPKQTLSFIKDKDSNIIGNMTFSKVLFNTKKSKAILMFVMRDNIKTGILKATFWSKSKEWDKENEIVLEIW